MGVGYHTQAVGQVAAAYQVAEMGRVVAFVGLIALLGTYYLLQMGPHGHLTVGHPLLKMKGHHNARRAHRQQAQHTAQQEQHVRSYSHSGQR